MTLASGDAPSPFSSVPLHYVADDRSLLQTKALGFDAVRESDLEDKSL